MSARSKPPKNSRNDRTMTPDAEMLVEALRDDNSDTPYSERHEGADLIESLSAKLDDLRAKADGLEPFLRHRPFCNDCNCGLNQALAAYRSAKP